MIEILLVLLITGFVLYYLVRHPIKSIKYTGAFIGLLFLGVLVFAMLFAVLTVVFT